MEKIIYFSSRFRLKLTLYLLDEKVNLNAKFVLNFKIFAKINDYMH